MLQRFWRLGLILAVLMLVGVGTGPAHRSVAETVEEPKLIAFSADGGFGTHYYSDGTTRTQFVHPDAPDLFRQIGDGFVHSASVADPVVVCSNFNGDPYVSGTRIWTTTWAPLHCVGPAGTDWQWNSDEDGAEFEVSGDSSELSGQIFQMGWVNGEYSWGKLSVITATTPASGTYRFDLDVVPSDFEDEIVHTFPSGDYQAGGYFNIAAEGTGLYSEVLTDTTRAFALTIFHDAPKTIVISEGIHLLGIGRWMTETIPCEVTHAWINVMSEVLAGIHGECSLERALSVPYTDCANGTWEWFDEVTTTFEVPGYCVTEAEIVSADCRGVTAWLSNLDPQATELQTLRLLATPSGTAISIGVLAGESREVSVSWRPALTDTQDITATFVGSEIFSTTLVCPARWYDLDLPLVLRNAGDTEPPSTPSCHLEPRDRPEWPYTYWSLVCDPEYEFQAKSAALVDPPEGWKFHFCDGAVSQSDTLCEWIWGGMGFVVEAPEWDYSRSTVRVVVWEDDVPIWSLDDEISVRRSP